MDQYRRLDARPVKRALDGVTTSAVAARARPPLASVWFAALRAMFRDNVKARRLTATGDYVRVEPRDDDPPFRVQRHLQEEARDRRIRARDRAGVSYVPERRLS